MKESMISKYQDRLVVLVCSCDKYVDLLKPFVSLWRKFWADCPFEMILVTETDPNIDGFNRVIACGGGMNWASRLTKALDEIVSPYVLMLCDDYYLSAPVDTSKIIERLNQAVSLGAVNLRLIPNPMPRSNNSWPIDSGLFEYRKNTAYCIATQVGIWEREFLRSLAYGKSSIWEFERYGSFAVGNEKRPLLVTSVKEFPFVDAVHKGYWERFGIAVCRENGVDVDFSKRRLPPFWVRLKEGVKALVFAVSPSTFLVRVQNMFGIGAKEKK